MKNPVLGPAKIMKIVEKHENQWIKHIQNPKDTKITRRNHIKITENHENQRKTENAANLISQNRKDTQRTLQNRVGKCKSSKTHNYIEITLQNHDIL